LAALVDPAPVPRAQGAAQGPDAGGARKKPVYGRAQAWPPNRPATLARGSSPAGRRPWRANPALRLRCN